MKDRKKNISSSGKKVSFTSESLSSSDSSDSSSSDNESDSVEDTDYVPSNSSISSEDDQVSSPPTKSTNLRRSERLEQSTDDEIDRSHDRYDLRPKVINPKKFGTMIYEFINQTVREHSELENPRSVKRRKITPPTNEMLPEPPFVPDTLSDLLKLIKLCMITPFKDCQELPPLLEALQDIENLIGLQPVKTTVVHHVIAYCQRKHFDKTEFNHMVIVGPPGCGKTTLSLSLAKLFNKMGKIKTDKVVVGNRRNMIGAFLGQTSHATQAVVDSALGGVLLIDEAYSLGDGRSTSGADCYSKECIDTLNQNLTEKGDEFICIVVGYKDQLLRDFFSVNPGLNRRFRWWMEIEPYKPDELSKIFVKMISDQKLILEMTCLEQCPKFFQTNRLIFCDHAGSVREFVDKIQIVHSKRVFGKDQKGIVNMEDLINGLKLFATKLSPEEHVNYSMYV